MTDNFSLTHSLICKNLSKVIGNQIVIDDLSLSLSPGTVNIICGNNGSGKTTLLKMLAGLVFPSKGQIYISDTTLNRNTLSQLLPRLGISVGISSLIPQLTPLQLLEYKLRFMGISGEPRRAIEIVGLQQYANQLISSLSSGNKMRTSLALALVHDPEILLFDEPTNALDLKGIEIFSELATAQARQGKTIVVTSHALDEMSGLVDTVAVLHEGRIVAHRNREQVSDLKEFYLRYTNRLVG